MEIGQAVGGEVAIAAERAGHDDAAGRVELRNRLARQLRAYDEHPPAPSGGRHDRRGRRRQG